jgi:hypothetical protein
MTGQDMTRLNWGCYVFASEQDAQRAKDLGLEYPSLVVWAAKNGHPGLELVLLKWVPGIYEGSQGPGWGACNAYVHVDHIDFLRAHWFGQPPVADDELPVYTGTDLHWLERHGADGSALDAFKKLNNRYRSTQALSELQVEQLLIDNRGFHERNTLQATAAGIVPPTPAEQVAKNVILEWSNPRPELFYPMKMQHPIDPAKPLREQTSFHAACVDLEHGKEAHGAHYLISGLETKNKPSFLKTPYTLLNSAGETMSTIFYDSHGAREIQLQDLPFLPQYISSDEDKVTLMAFKNAGTDWPQITAHIDPATRQTPNCYQTRANRFRSDPVVGKPTFQTRGVFSEALKKASQLSTITAAHEQLNCGRGRFPGKIDPSQAENAVVLNPFTNQMARNWIDFPNTPHPKTLAAKLYAERSGERKEADEAQRIRLALKQTQGMERAYQD